MIQFFPWLKKKSILRCQRKLRDVIITKQIPKNNVIVIKSVHFDKKGMI